MHFLYFLSHIFLLMYRESWFLFVFDSSIKNKKNEMPEKGKKIFFAHCRWNHKRAHIHTHTPPPKLTHFFRFLRWETQIRVSLFSWMTIKIVVVLSPHWLPGLQGKFLFRSLLCIDLNDVKAESYIHYPKDLEQMATAAVRGWINIVPLPSHSLHSQLCIYLSL